MPRFEPLPPHIQAEHLSGRVLELCANRPSALGAGALALALLHVLKDPTLPARPQAWVDLSGELEQFIAEWHAFASGNRAFFSKKYGELLDDPKAPPS